jgi:hypothetical protein
LETLFIQSERLEQQIEEVQESLGPPPEPSLSRCSVCNVVLEDVSADEVADRVPPYVLETHTEFRHCPGCDRVYWSGSHVQHMSEQLGGFELS